MAVSKLKNSAKTGSNNVPNPKPEKKVRREANSEINAIVAYIIKMFDDTPLTRR